MTLPPFSPRRANAADAGQIADLVNRAYEKYLPRIGRPPSPMVADYPAVVARHDVWILEAKDQIIAVLVLIPESDILLIDNIAVDPTTQGGGVGRRLMAFAEREAWRGAARRGARGIHRSASTRTKR